MSDPLENFPPEMRDSQVLPYADSIVPEELKVVLTPDRLLEMLTEYIFGNVADGEGLPAQFAINIDGWDVTLVPEDHASWGPYESPPDEP